jgi:hypothetical protein
LESHTSQVHGKSDSKDPVDLPEKKTSLSKSSVWEPDLAAPQKSTFSSDSVFELFTELESKIALLRNEASLSFEGWWTDGTHSEVRLHSRSEVLGRASHLGHFAIDEELSRKHVKVWLDKNAICYVKDEGSLNGTYVNEARISTQVEVRPLDVVRIGNTKFKVKRWFPKQEEM